LFDTYFYRWAFFTISSQILNYKLAFTKNLRGKNIHALSPEDISQRKALRQAFSRNNSCHEKQQLINKTSLTFPLSNRSRSFDRFFHKWNLASAWEFERIPLRSIDLNDNILFSWKREMKVKITQRTSFLL